MANDASGASDGAANPADRPETMVGAGGADFVRIDFFPGESDDGQVARGRFYVYYKNELLQTYDACGGPPPARGYDDRGGHVAGPTRAGAYVLAAAEHHTTDSWPTSTIPWGAKIRARPDAEIEFSTDDGQTWIAATGLQGVVTRSWIAFEQRTRAQNAAHTNTQPAPLTDQDIAQINEGARNFFYKDGAVVATWQLNDFGVWAWNLTQPGPHGPVRSDMFVHTTPTNEAQTAAGTPVALTQSHGCIHVRPADRDEMMTLGYLQRGVHFVVKAYGVVGP